MPPIFNLITDENLQVKETVSWCLGRIAELVVDAIDVNTMLPPIIDALINGLKDHPKVATNCCWTLINLNEQLNALRNDSSINVFTSYLPRLIPALLELSASTENEHSCRTSAYEALSTIVVSSADCDKPLISQIAGESLQRLNHTIGLQMQFQTGKLIMNGEEKALLEELQSNILSLLTNIIRRIGEGIIENSNDLMTKFLELLQIQTEDSIIEEDIFMAISAIATAINRHFEASLYANISTIFDQGAK